MQRRLNVWLLMAGLTLVAMALVYWLFPDSAAVARHFLREALRALF